MASLTALLALGAAALVGGWEWVVVGLAGLLPLWKGDFSLRGVLATIAASGCWLAAYHWTGDRRLFFPYAMQFALQAAYLTRGTVSRPLLFGGGGLVTLFMLIRILQDASARVLVVELVVAIGILLVVWKVAKPDQQRATRIIAGILASLLAFASLAI